jgi:cytochrome c553
MPRRLVTRDALSIVPLGSVFLRHWGTFHERSGKPRSQMSLPPLRRPSYLARQLNDCRTGARKGASWSLMTGAVAKLTDEDIVNLAAYAASREP